MRVLPDLFAFDADELPGERVHFRLFEAFVGVAAVMLAWRWALYTRHLDGLAHPLGLAVHVDLSGLLAPGVPGALAAAVAVLVLLGYTRRAPGASYALAFVLLHVLYVLRFSLGKAEHGTNFVGMSLLGLALGMALFEDARARRRFTFGFVWLFVGLAYVLAACSKLVGTGLAWPDGTHLWVWMGERAVDATSRHGSHTPNVLQHFLGTHHAMATLLLAAGLLVESLGWMLWWRRTRPFITLALVGMHVGITLVLGIRFTLYVVELLLVGLPWPALWARYRPHAPGPGAGRPVWRRSAP